MARPQTASLPELKFSFLLHLAVGGWWGRGAGGREVLGTLRGSQP